MTEDGIKATDRFRERGIPILIAIGLMAIAISLFWPATRYGFINLDDCQYVQNNEAVIQGLHWDSIRWAFTSVLEQWWLPLLWISYMADTDLFGLTPFGYHLTNVLLHGANTALLFWVLFRMTKSRWQSAFVAALFAVHPLRVEAVAWITSRKDTLSGIFYFLSLLAYLRYVEHPSRSRFLLLLGLMALGLLSKPILVVLPLVLLLLDYWPLRRAGDPRAPSGWKQWMPLLEEKLPLFYLVIACVLINLKTHITGLGAGAPVSPLSRLGLMGPNFFSYLGKIVWPAQLTVLYPENDVVHWPISIAAWLGLIAATILLVRLREKKPFLIVGWSWFLLTLLPMIRGVRLGLAAYADRYTYIPLIGLGILLAWGACELWSVGKWKILPAAGGGIILAVCMLMTHAQLPFWKNSMTLFSRAIQFAPQSHLMNFSYGQALYQDERYDEALVYLDRAIQLDPANAEDIADKGLVLANLKRVDEAVACYQESIRLNPKLVKTYVNLGDLLAATGQKEKALLAYRDALHILPLNAELHYTIANLLFTMQRWQEALSHYQQAASRQPEWALAWYNMGIIYAQSGQFVEARRCVEEAIKLDPNLPNASQTLTRIQAELSRMP